jgi:HlyD family secretion protein
MNKVLWVLALGLTGTALYLMLAGPASEETSLEADFKTTEVLQGEFALKISAKGVVEPGFQVEVKSKASGEVLRFDFEEGDRIEKGQLLLQLDKSDEKRNVAKAQADLSSSLAQVKKAEASLALQTNKYETDKKRARSEVESAQASLDEASDKLKRQQDLFQKQFTSRESLDAAQTEFKVQSEQLIQARAQAQEAEDAIYDIAIKENDIALAKAQSQKTQIALAEAKERLQETEIFAPISGVILEKMVEVGQIIASGISNVSGGTALATIADISNLFIVADVDETDIGQVQTGQEVEISADAYPGIIYKGKVIRIAPQGLVEKSITLFKVKIEIIGEGKTSLKPMMSANTDIIISRKDHALYVSRGAIHKGESGRVAVILENGSPKEIPVEIGLQNPIHAEVLSGLNAGQQVVTGDWKKVLEEAKKKGNKSSALRKILWMIRSK